MSGAALLTLLLLAAGPAPQKLAAMDVQANEGITPGLAKVVTEAVVADVRHRAPGLKVIASEDLRNLLGFQSQKSKLGCQDTACLAEIGGALGVDLLLVGSLSKLGKSYILDLRLIDSRHVQVLNEANERLKDRADEDLLDAADRAVAAVLAPLAPLVTQPEPAVRADLTQEPPPVKHPRPAAIALGAVGLAAGAVAVVGLVEMLSFKGYASQTPGSTIENPGATVSTANTWATVALITAIGGAGCLTAAGLTW